MAAHELTLDDRQFTLISKAIADPRRFEILQKIRQSGQSPTCSAICELVGISAATVSHHIRELGNAGLVNVERDGKFAHLTIRRDVWNAYLKRLALL